VILPLQDSVKFLAACRLEHYVRREQGEYMLF